MDYDVKLLLLFRSTVAGIKIASHTIVAIPRQQNHNSGAFCVTFVRVLEGKQIGTYP
jgi:hypothetical protein